MQHLDGDVTGRRGARDLERVMWSGETGHAADIGVDLEEVAPSDRG